MHGTPKCGKMASENILLALLESATQHGKDSTHFDIVDCHQDVFTLLGFWKWSHAVDAPDIKEL
jgi:hypothetical protein